jgi:hypothetical protein
MKRAIEVLNELTPKGISRAGWASPLTPEAYEKRLFRSRMAALPIEEKVRCIVAMQKRLVPIYAARGIRVRPWRSVPLD